MAGNNEKEIKAHTYNLILHVIENLKVIKKNLEHVKKAINKNNYDKSLVILHSILDNTENVFHTLKMIEKIIRYMIIVKQGYTIKVAK